MLTERQDFVLADEQPLLLLLLELQLLPVALSLNLPMAVKAKCPGQCIWPELWLIVQGGEMTDMAHVKSSNSPAFGSSSESESSGGSS